MNILTFTNLYPNPEQPDRGNFIAQMVHEIGSEINSSVVCPLPWFPPVPVKISERSIFRKIPFHIKHAGEEIYYPKYLIIPKISGLFHAFIITARCYYLIKKLIKSHKIDLIHAHWIYPDCVAAVWIAKKLSIPVIVSARGCDINLYKNSKTRKPQIKWTLEHADAITAVSESLRNTIINDFNIKADNVKTIRNGVDTTLFKKMNKTEARSSLCLKLNLKYLIFIGPLDEVKGINYLINALNCLNKTGGLDFITLIVGDGQERQTIENEIGQFKLHESIKLIGHKRHDEIPVWMNASDVLCLPSLREGVPNVIIESQACGLPVVATDVGGIPEIVNKKNGILVPPRDVKALSKALSTAINRSDWNIYSSTPHTWKNCAKKYIELYDSVVKKRMDSK